MTLDHIRQLAVLKKALTLICERHPGLSLEHAHLTLMRATTLAFTIDLTDMPIDQAASEVANDKFVCEELPPWL